jgi:hypothetical protein
MTPIISTVLIFLKTNKTRYKYAMIPLNLQEWHQGFVFLATLVLVSVSSIWSTPSILRHLSHDGGSTMSGQLVSLSIRGNECKQTWLRLLRYSRGQDNPLPDDNTGPQPERCRKETSTTVHCQHSNSLTRQWRQKNTYTSRAKYAMIMIYSALMTQKH